jgi:hypothetical protein
MLVSDLFENSVLNEASEFASLEKHKVDLTPEERKMVMDGKAVWHKGPGGKESPAVWKSVNPKTKKTTYVTNTHRAYKIASTCKGAIGKYHSSIKGTA